MGSREHEIGTRIVKEGERIAGIVQSLLSYTRQGEKERKPRHVDELLSDSLTLTRSQIRKDRIELLIKVPENLPRVVVNAQEIQQVFLNLLNNARYALNLKYPGIHEAKSMEIIGEQVGVGGVPFVRIAFLDRGTGIPARLLDRVTTPFFSTKPEGKGTGLGLAISQRIIHEHGGRMAIDSVEGEYTRVTIALPARIEHEGQDSHH